MFVQHFKSESPLGPSSRVVDDGACRDTDLIRFSAKQVDNIIRKMTKATIIARVLDGLMDVRLKDYLSLHDGQFGFRSDLSTESAILVLKNTVHCYTNRGTPIYACFVDLCRAFDLPSYDVLWGKLREGNLHAELLRLFQYWYHNQFNNVRRANNYSTFFGLNYGVRQGGITSPRLFSLYINELILELSSLRIVCRIDDVSINNISYADDMALLSPTVRALRELLGICERYAQRHGLIYNVNKSVFMIFRAVKDLIYLIDQPNPFLQISYLKRENFFVFIKLAA
ncbi:hypothetical protein evm_012665 [Chilo suppressalis]|nr:hypothetical protein evm_012665 [Chilo suppressalis]